MLLTPVKICNLNITVHKRALFQERDLQQSQVLHRIEFEYQLLPAIRKRFFFFFLCILTRQFAYYIWPFSARLKPSPDTGPVSRGSCYPTLRRNEGEGWGTHFSGRVEGHKKQKQVLRLR